MIELDNPLFIVYGCTCDLLLIKLETINTLHAYQKLQLEESSQEYVSINTHRGLYCYTRLPFGVTSAPAIFQRTMETLLQGLPMVCV